MRLSHQSGSRITNTITRHIAKTLCRNSKEWEAMAILPRGATIMVLTICALLINMFCMAIGMLILQAL